MKKENSDGTFTAVVNTQSKTELAIRVHELMPAGRPAFTSMIQYPTFQRLMDHMGPAVSHKVLMMLLRDLASAFGIVRNMTTEQMIDAASFLMSECGNFRLEDFVMMFTLAKRGQLHINDGKGVMDRLDIEIVGKMLDAYHVVRSAAGHAAQEAEFERGENLWKMGTRDVMPEEIVDLTKAKTDWRDMFDDKDEQERKDREMRERRDRDVANFERLMAVPRFAQRLIDGEPITSDEDLQFYQNHASEIERSIQAITAASKPAKSKSDYPDPHKFRIRTADPNTPPPTLNSDRKD